MRRNKVVAVLIFFTAIIISDSLNTSHKVAGYDTGPPAGFCGAPGEGGVTCAICHTGPVPTFTPGMITSNVPADGYVPGNTYSFTACVQRPGHVKFGFEISPQDSFGSPLGELIDMNPETQIVGTGNYISHTLPGTYNNGIDSVIWTFDWTAPNAGTGVVNFYGAFNITDSNNSNNHDTILTSILSVPENIFLDASDVASVINNIIVFPNPASDYFNVDFNLASAKNIGIKLYDLGGRISELTEQIKMVPGNYSKRISIPDSYSSGIYYLAVSVDEKLFFKKIIVER